VTGLFISFAASEILVYGFPSVDYLVQSNSAVYAGWYWQLLTSMFVVVPYSPFQGPLGVADVLFNAFAIIILDGLLSHAFREWEYYMVFLLCGLAGNIASLLNGPSAVSFGASGGIFGLLAGAVVVDFVIERRMNYALWAWFLLIFIFSSFALSYVDWFAHLGGAATGILAGYLVGKRRGSETL